MSADKFATGAQRGAQEGKGRYDLVSTIATRELALLLEKGATEYGERNWEKGIPIMRHLSSAKRHIDQFIERQVTEVNSKGETVFIKHAVNAFANMMMAIHTLAKIESGDLPKELDDRPVSKAGQGAMTSTELAAVREVLVRPRKPFLYTVISYPTKHSRTQWDIKRLSDGFVMDSDGMFVKDLTSEYGWYTCLPQALEMYDSIGLSRADLLNKYGEG